MIFILVNLFYLATLMLWVSAKQSGKPNSSIYVLLLLSYVKPFTLMVLQEGEGFHIR